MQFYSSRSPPSPMDPYSPPFSPAAYVSPTISYANQSTFYPQDPPPIPVDDIQYDANIHPYWRDRVVPRPGFKSSRALGPTPESSRIVIKDPNKLNHFSKQQLLIPRSYVVSKRQSQDKNGTKEKSPDSSPTISAKHGLDRYAPSFVPQSLRNIQRAFYQLEPLPPVPRFPPPDYSSTFLVPHLIEEKESHLLSKPPPPSDEKKPLEPNSYHEHWSSILQAEVDCLCAQRSNTVLWKVKDDLKLTDWKRHQFSLAVPGLRENHPRLEAGDLVKMRQVVAAQNPHIEPFFGTGVAFEARVIASQKREGVVHLYCPTLQEYIQLYFSGIALYLAQTDNHIPFQLPLIFNISFLVNAHPFCLMDVAVADLNSALNVETENNLTARWLFPTAMNFLDFPPRDIPDPNNGLRWIDKDLNEEQKNAVASIALRQWPVPFLISGPAGTGKTKTIVESVLQILAVQPDACILLCAPSNPATDTLVLRLRNSLKPSEMFRLNDHGRPLNQVPSKLLQFCYIDATAENKFGIPPFRELMKYRVVVCSCVDAGILTEAQCTNRILMRLEDEIMSSIHPHSTARTPAKPHWTHLLIDEAAQGSEPELCIPINVVTIDAPGPSTTPMSESMQPQLILCGDRYQLGPIVSSDEARKDELDLSLLQRLFERPLYASEASTPEYFRPCAHLRRNYRSHPAILMPPSALFYNDTLLPCATNGRISWSNLPDQRLPVKIIGCEGDEECIDEKSTWYNLGEIEVVLSVVKSLLKEGHSCDPPLRTRNIGIISPFRAQVWKLREILREEGLRDVDVGTVEDWQGRENRVIIVSCVRSQARFLEDDFQKGLGLFKEAKRMNVAITRAKELLVVIGNPQRLQEDPYWKSYLQFALRNNLYEGPQLDLEVDGNYISKLEAALLHEGSHAVVDPEKIGTVIAGIVAGEVLRE